MKLKRSLLSVDLNVIEPAIADKSSIPGLDSIWFDGKTVSAYNDIIGIEKPLETDFVGGVTGKIMLGYLSKTTAEDVSLITKKTGKSDLATQEEYHDLNISAGQSRIRLALRPLSGKLWSVPDYNKSTNFIITKDFLTLLSYCLVSVNKNSAITEQLGVTFETNKDELNLYATDATTLSWARLPKPKNYNHKRLTVPGEFCEQLLKLCLPEDSLHLSTNAAIAINRSGTTLFGRILEMDDNPYPFAKRVPQFLPKFDMIAIPPELNSTLDRAELLRQGKSGDPVQFTINENKLSLYLNKPELGEFQEELEIEEGHPKIAVMLDPSLIKRALSDREYFSLDKFCLTMTGPDIFTHIISTMHQ